MNQLPELLEAAMLICFGLSWPISLVKNIRARTARSMSLPFSLLICAGYVAGIAAKLMRGDTAAFVLAVYAINLAMVSANVAVYLRNRRLDRM